jgi:hypothetical protein
MSDMGYTSRTLAELINHAVGDLTGRLGGLDESNIRAWRSGRVRCPKSAQLHALELVSGRTAAELGFVRRVRPPAPTSQENSAVYRRRFLTAAVATAAASAVPTPSAAAHRVGMTDVTRLQAAFADIVASDHRHGGQLAIEREAARMADQALALQSAGSASQRVRASLYGAAASFRSSAMWAAIDGCRFGEAVAHMQQAQALAEMSGDAAIKFRIWSHAGTMYRHMGRPAEAASANAVARATAVVRRDPLFASLGLARQGAIHAAARDPRAARRAFGRAQDALHRAAPDEPRPLWLTAFYDEAEIHSLALSAYLSLGEWETAESHAHKCLGALRPHMARSRAITTARLARAQLEQGEAQTAVNTARLVPAPAATGHPRVADMLNAFGHRLLRIAPDGPHAEAWRSHRTQTGFAL